MPVVTEDEVRFLSKLRRDLVFKELGIYKGVKLYRWIVEGKCPFLDDKKTCTIHDRKPAACEMYPLLLNLSTGEVYLSDACLWVKLNGPRSLEEFPKETEALKKLRMKLRI